jgi:hypothetical protein
MPLIGNPIATGPLIVSPNNPRYFARPDGSCVYFNGSHTWNNLQEWGPNLTTFDFDAYLDFLGANHCTFMRLWTHEVPRGSAGWPDSLFFFDPLPFARPGPGTAADGKPRFDLTTFNQAYFERLRARVIAAGERGIYVGIMLFNGFSLWDKAIGGMSPWTYNPFNSTNNINSINGDPARTGTGRETHTLNVAATLSIQRAYVEKVVDTVNDLDNVLYEIANEDEPEAKLWQYDMIGHINTYQAGKAQQHPVGMTVLVGTGVAYHFQECLDSAAQWVSPGNTSPFNTNNPTATDGSKIVVIDIDHTRPTAATSDVWTWRSFLRGYSVIHMDTLSSTGIGGESSPIVPDLISYDGPMRRGMKQTSQYASRLDLRTAVPNGGLSSTGFCLANPGSQYLTLAPSGSALTVNLSAGLGRYFSVEWLKVSDGTVSTASDVGGGSSSQSFSSPFGRAASVLFLNRRPDPAAG